MRSRLSFYCFVLGRAFEIHSRGGLLDRTLEREINELLLRWSNVEKVGQILFDKLMSTPLSFAHESTIFYFLFRSGNDQKIINLFLKRLVHKEPIPWNVMIEVFERNKIKPTRELMDALFTGALETKTLENIIQTHVWEKHDSRFQDLREEFKSRLQDSVKNKTLILKEKLGFLANHRMIDEEKKVLEMLSELLPEDIEIKQMELDFQERWARQVLIRSSQEVMQHQVQYPEYHHRDKEEEKFLALWLYDFHQIMNRNQEQAYNFAIFYIHLEAWDYALQVLLQAPSNLAKDWLQLEVLLQCRLFIECLGEVDRVEARYSDDPETSFSATYCRARALFGLGQKSLAIESLQSIAEVRPNYRSIKTLLREWVGERAG